MTTTKESNELEFESSQNQLSHLTSQQTIFQSILKDPMKKYMAIVIALLLITVVSMFIFLWSPSCPSRSFATPKGTCDVDLEWKYPTLGCPTEEKKQFNFKEVELKDAYKWEERMADLLFKPYNDTSCVIKRYGNEADGGYLVCENILNKSEALLNFGIESRDHFGCELIDTHPMTNYQFDCSSFEKPTCPKNKQKNVFLSVCLNDRTEWKEAYNFASLKDLIDSNGLKGKHITIKIDIEGGEWPGFRTLPIEYLDYIDQIIMEVHLPSIHTSHLAYQGNLDIIQSLSKKFVNVNLHMTNIACHVRYNDTQYHYFNAYAFEVALVNRNLIKINNPSRSYSEHHLNNRNFDWVDVVCPMHD